MACLTGSRRLPTASGTTRIRRNRNNALVQHRSGLTIRAVMLRLTLKFSTTEVSSMLKRSLIGSAALSVLLLSACSRTTASDDASNWLMYGRTYDDHRFSPLKQINEETVGKLGLAWSRELGTTRGLEATPLVKDGIIYTTGSWSVVYAIDAKTGELRWTYDPKVPRERALFICCDVVNRGVAPYSGKVY